MFSKVIEKNKGVLLFVVMLILFSFVATRRVERLEQNVESNEVKLVYNKWKKVF